MMYAVCRNSAKKLLLCIPIKVHSQNVNRKWLLKVMLGLYKCVDKGIGRISSCYMYFKGNMYISHIGGLFFEMAGEQVHIRSHFIILE